MLDRNFCIDASLHNMRRLCDRVQTDEMAELQVPEDCNASKCYDTDVIAPDEQTHIPMILWLSDGFERRTGIDLACMEAHADEEYSHDNVFSSVLGLMDVETEVYDRALDFTARCRVARGAINHPATRSTPGDVLPLALHG